MREAGSIKGSAHFFHSEDFKQENEPKPLEKGVWSNWRGGSRDD